MNVSQLKLRSEIFDNDVDDDDDNNNNNNNNNTKTLETERIWNVEAKVKPVIAGATGTISESLRQYLNNIVGKHEIRELHKTTALGAAHILRGVLM